MKYPEFVGMYHIFEMELWSENYFNMEVQAYIKINSDGFGEFQFCLVSGTIIGSGCVEYEEREFEFEWEGADECDPAAGSGWVKIKDKDTIEGEFSFEYGDTSKFSARRLKAI